MASIASHTLPLYVCMLLCYFIISLHAPHLPYMTSSRVLAKSTNTPTKAAKLTKLAAVPLSVHIVAHSHCDAGKEDSLD